VVNKSSSMLVVSP